MAPPVRYFSVDIETAGPVPGHHPMLSLGAVVLEPEGLSWSCGPSFYAELKPSHAHVVPEALDGGAIAKLQDGDIVRVDAVNGALEIITEGVLDRPAVTADLSAMQRTNPPRFRGLRAFLLFPHWISKALTNGKICFGCW